MEQPGCEQLRLQVLSEVGAEPDGKVDEQLVCCSRPGLRRTGSINVWSLFPGWPTDKTVSLQNFITEWLVDWLQVSFAVLAAPLCAYRV